jgi:uncharacterized protein YukE
MNVGYPTLEGASIPGDPDGLAAIASQLQAAHDDISTVQERVAVDGVVASWEGSAADRFRSSLDKLPAELGTVAGAFDAASGRIRSFAGQLVDFQNNAHYYANRIKSLEEEIHSSQRRHDEAQVEVDAARVRESAASDPISLKTAVDAVKDGLGKLQLALDGVEANRGELECVRREAQTNREDYEQAVRACCTALQDATESTTHSNGAPHIAVGTLIAGAVSRLLHDVRDHEPADDTPTTTSKTTPGNRVAPQPKTTPAITPPASTGTSPAAMAAITWARKYLGTPYKDGYCLEFATDAYAAAGINIGSASTAADYWYENPKGYVQHWFSGVLATFLVIQIRLAMSGSTSETAKYYPPARGLSCRAMCTAIRCRR